MHSTIRFRQLLVACAAAVLLTACMPSSDAITNRPWKLVELNGSMSVVEAGVDFGVDGRYSVQPGCNSGGGTYAINGNRITTATPTLTAMSCGNPADAQEQAFLAALNAGPRFEIETQTGRLRLVTDAVTLVFVTP
ncbi:MAG: META domain-containing protein [Chloroflexota bacterium]